MEREGYRRPRLCRFCECPVVDGGVPLRKTHLDRLSRCTKAHLAEQNSCLICHFCVWDIRLADRYSRNKGPTHGKNTNGLDSNFCYYADGLMTPCSVKITPLANEEFRQRESSGHVQQCPQSCPNETDAVTICATYIKTEEDKQMQAPEIHLEKFKCIFCSSTYKWQKGLSRHIRSHHDDVALRCKYTHCAAYFKSERDRQNHHEVHESGANKVMCPVCNKLVSKRLIPFHIHLHIINEKKIKEEKEKHAKEVQPAEKIREQLSCIYCDQILAGKDTLRSHIELKHAGIAIKCQYPKCGVFFKCQKDLENHFSLKPKHKDINLLKCDLCQMEFYRKTSIENHIMIYHSKPGVCPLCEEICSRKARHIFSSFCRKCKKKFQCLGLLKSHTLKCKPVFHCPVCSKSFKSHSELNYHCKINHTVPILKWKGLQFESRGFKCQECSIYFSRKNNLTQHQKICNRSLKLTCDTCKKQFLKANLYLHMKRHHLGIETKLYPCPICNLKLTRASGLRKHVERKHSIQELVQCQICTSLMKPIQLKKHLKCFH